MNLKLENNLLSCSFGKYSLSSLTARLEYSGNHYNVLHVASGDWELNENGNLAISKVQDGTFTLTAKKTNGGMSLQLAFKSSIAFSQKKCRRLVINGFMSVKPQILNFNYPQVMEQVRNLEMSSTPLTIGLSKNQREECAQYCAFKTKYNVYGVVGFVSFDNYFGEIAINQNGEFEAYSNLELCELLPAETIKTDECWITFKRNNPDILTAYGKRIAVRNKVAPKIELPSGWCSWYYYGRNISHQTIVDNMLELKKNDVPVKYIQIDSGWQKCWGDWEPNEKFPKGMKALADEIKAEGYIPGIWVAPFCFEPDSQTFKDNPEFFLKDKDGNPDQRKLIDFSNKGARKWLYDLAHKLSVEWGYRYIKIDLITFAIAPNGYPKHGFNANKNFREAFKIMRSAVTPDTVFLSCTSPLGASAGIAECLRTSDDIFERWNSLQRLAKQVIPRYFINEYINTDPDCLLVRTLDKHDDEAFRICVRNELEIQTFINFMSAAGGALMLSDKLPLLDKKDFEKIKTLFPLNPAPAKPLDLFESNTPSILYYGDREGFDMYAIFNWANVNDTFTIDLKKEKFVKIYAKDEIVKTSKFEITLQPHASAIIYISDDKNEFARLTSSIMPPKK